MREEDFDTDKLAHYRLIHRVLAVRAGIKPADLDLLLHLNPIKLFTLEYFNDGTFTMNWDRNRFSKLKQAGWIKKVYEGRGYKGGHNKYSTTQKTKLLIAKIGRIIDGREDLPEIRVPNGYAQKNLNKAVRKFNEQKYKDARHEGIYG